MAGIRPDIFLLTGDLADRGEAACYDSLAGIIAGAATRSGAGIVYVPGNHDDRDTFRRHLLGGTGPDPGPGGTGGGPINQTHWRGGLRIIALDSTVPGEDHGVLDDQTLGYLNPNSGQPPPTARSWPCTTRRSRRRSGRWRR